MIDYETAARHWEDKEADARRVPEFKLREEIERFIGSHHVCALATASADGSLVRNTPLEYTWADGAFLIFSEGGLKFRALATNKNVCLAIFDTDTSFDNLRGMQVTGEAAVVEPFSPAYTAACKRAGIGADALRELPFTMNLIRIVPTRVDFLDAAFKGEGYDVRQWWERSGGAPESAPAKAPAGNPIACDDPFMQVALDEAYAGITRKEGGPFGSCIVKDGAVVGRGHNRVLASNDSTAHGEISAIRDAERNLGTYNLAGCELYTTGEPCSMCLAACKWSNIALVHYGATIEDNARIGFRDEEFDNLFGGRGQFADCLVQTERDACLALFGLYVEHSHTVY